MARNGGKSRGAQPRQSSGSGGSGRLPFFFGGLLLGLLLAFGGYLLKILPTAMQLRERDKAHEAACAAAAEEKGKPAAVDNGKGAKPGEKPANGKNGDDKPVTFEFYTMLPQQEVVAPVTGNKTTVATPQPAPSADKSAKPAASTTPAATATTTPAASPAAGKYMLQAGSFRTREEADRRRASLVLSGLNVSIQDVKVASGETWFRVMVGPFADESSMQKGRQQLAALKVDTLPIRLK